LGWGGLHGAPLARSARTGGLFGETGRTRKRNGCLRYCVWRPTSATLSGLNRLAQPARSVIASARASALVLYLTRYLCGVVQGELTTVAVTYCGSFMTRCLDCGSERTTDQCPSCGLTTAAAELMFRHRLMRQTGIFLLGSLAFPYISQIYPPLDLDLILVFFGLIFFGALTLAI